MSISARSVLTKPSRACTVAVSRAEKGRARFDVMLGVRMMRWALNVIRVRRKAWIVAMGVVRWVERLADHALGVSVSIGCVG